MLSGRVKTMNKKEYLDSIRSKLTGLPEKDIDSAIEYYEEAIEDRIEDGLTEEQAINAVGTPEEIAEKILMDSSIPKLITAKAKPQRRLKGWEIALIIIGSPLWIMIAAWLLIIFLWVILVLFFVMLAIICFVLGIIVGSLGGIVAGIAQLFSGGGAQALALIGICIMMLGIGVLLVVPVKAAVTGLWELIAKFIRWVKRKLIGNKAKKTEINTEVN